MIANSDINSFFMIILCLRCKAPILSTFCSLSRLFFYDFVVDNSIGFSKGFSSERSDVGYRSDSSMLNRSKTSWGFGVSIGSAVKDTGALAERGVSPVDGIMTSSQSDTSMFMLTVSPRSLSVKPSVDRLGSEPCTEPVPPLPPCADTPDVPGTPSKSFDVPAFSCKEKLFVLSSMSGRSKVFMFVSESDHSIEMNGRSGRFPGKGSLRFVSVNVDGLNAL